jgi:hypothetical protein
VGRRHAPPDDDAQPESPNGPYGFAILIRQTLFTLTPFFMDGADGDAAYTRAAAREILVSYRAGSALEIQPATECIVFAYSAMETLRQAKADPEMPDTTAPPPPQQRRIAKPRQPPQPSQPRRPPQFPKRAPQPPKSGPQDPIGIMPVLLEKIAQHHERMAAARARAAPPPPIMNRQQHRSAELTARREARRAQRQATPSQATPRKPNRHFYHTGAPIGG